MRTPVISYSSQLHKSELKLSLGAISVFAVLIMVFVMGLVKIYSPDLGFHLKSAEQILKNKKFIYIDTFSYGSDGRPYYDLQWLFQLLVFFLYKIGQPVLVIANALLISFSIALTWFRFSKYPTTTPKNIKAVVFAFIALLLVQSLTFEIRPHVLSWIYLNLLLLALESYKRGKHNAVFFLPVIMLFWVNTHSLSILGLVTIGIYNVGLCLENKKIDKKLLLFSALALAAFLINPYFFNGLLFPFKQFEVISGNGLAKDYVKEFKSPFAASEVETALKYFFSNPVLALLYLSPVLVIICLIRSLLQKNFTDALLLAVYLFLFNLGYKNYGYHIMVSLPLIAKYLTDWPKLRIMAKQEKKPALSQKEKNKEEAVLTTWVFNKKVFYGMATVTIFLAILISITCINDGYRISSHGYNRFGFTEDKNRLPVEATDFLVKNNIRGKILNHFNFGGYLMEHANAKVFIDGRIELIGDDFFSKYYSSVTEENGVKSLLDSFNPDIVIFPYMDGGTWWQYFLTHKNTSGYKVVYFDGLSVIYLRSSGFAQIPELTAHSVLKDLDVNAIKKLDSLIRSPDKPYGAEIWWGSIWKKQLLPVADAKKALFCFVNEFDTAALIYSVNMMERSTVHTDITYLNLSAYYGRKEMYNEAQLCENKIRESENKLK